MHVSCYVLYSTRAITLVYSVLSCLTTIESCSCTVHEIQASKPLISWTTYIFNIDTATNIGYQRWYLLVVNVYVARAQSSFYHFRTVVTCATFGLLAVAAFVMSSNMPTAD